MYFDMLWSGTLRTNWDLALYQIKMYYYIIIIINVCFCIRPAFLPDPKDGSLYAFNSGKTGENLKKLPFTIPELVTASPCKSSDGILYTGECLILRVVFGIVLLSRYYDNSWNYYHDTNHTIVLMSWKLNKLINSCTLINLAMDIASLG